MENYGNVEGSGNGDPDGERWAGRGRGRGRSSAEEQPSSHLRRPHHPAEGVSDIVKNSQLSAEAAEFVPKSFTSPTQSGRSSVQQRLDLARQSQNVQQAMLHQRQPQQPYWQQQQSAGNYHHHHQQHQHQQYSGMGYQHANQHGMQQQQYNQYPVIQNYSNYNSGSDADYIMANADAGQPIDLPTCLSQLDSAMKTLTMNPGKFDSLVGHLVDTISSFLDQPSQCKEIFGLILQQSINEGNFRYSGARLCTHLDTVASTVDKSTSNFRETLIEECKKKTDEQAETWQQMTKHTDDIEKKCHGLIFFLAELVTQMEAAPASELGKLLIRLINTVLQNPAPTSAKNICQALKLAGQTLERDNSGNRADMEQVMRTLSDLVIQGRVDVHVGRMVTSVSELRSGNWGKGGTTHTAPIIENQQSSSQVADEPIFYGPDGQVLTDEESRFLEAAAEGEAMPEDPWENDDEDDVIAEAFEEFLKLPPNSNKANKNNIQTNNSQEH